MQVRFTHKPIMSFKSFQLTRKRCNDFRAHFKDCPETFEDSTNQGFTYLDGTLWIAHDKAGTHGTDAYWTLVESSEFYLHDLESVERLLFEYATIDIEEEPPEGCPIRAALTYALDLVEKHGVGEDATKAQGVLLGILDQRGVEIDGKPLLGASDDWLTSVVRVSIYG